MDHQQVTRFTALWTQTQTSVLAFIAASVTHFADAEDILQRVAEVAITKFERFDIDGDANAFTGWAIQIARFEVLAFLRTRSTDRHQFVEDSIDAIVGAFAELGPEIDERRHALADCVQELKGRPREVLARRYGEGLKTGKIAGLMGLTPGNVSVILNRTYKALRVCIDSRLNSEAV